MDTNIKQETRAFMLAGCAGALVCSIALGFVVGIGGALVSAVAGIAATCIACAIRNRIAKNAQRSLQGHTQIQGILDSSQLDAGDQASVETIPFARRGKLVAAAISLTFCLTAGAIVGVATRGTGINFYLGQTPKENTSKNATSSKTNASSTKSTPSDSQDWGETYDSDYDVVETWYPPEEEATQNPTVDQEQPSSDSSPTNSNSSTASPATEPAHTENTQNAENTSSTTAHSTPANEQSTATQTPANSGTIDSATQTVQEQ